MSSLEEGEISEETSPKGGFFISEKKSSSSISESDEESQETLIRQLKRENSRLKTKLEQFTSTSPLLLCTIIWKNISGSDRNQIEEYLQTATLSESEKKTLVDPVDYFQFDSKQIESSTSVERASYQSRPISEPSSVIPPVKKGPQCFNCGEYGHVLSKCPKPRDAAKVSRIRGELSKADRRYHVSYEPGVLSQELKDALGLQPGENPPWYDRMRKMGYPPAYFSVVQEAELQLFDDKEPQQQAKVQSTHPVPTVEYPGLDIQELLSVDPSAAKNFQPDVIEIDSQDASPVEKQKVDPGKKKKADQIKEEQDRKEAKKKRKREKRERRKEQERAKNSEPSSGTEQTTPSGPTIPTTEPLSTPTSSDPVTVTKDEKKRSKQKTKKRPRSQSQTEEEKPKKKQKTKRRERSMDEDEVQDSPPIVQEPKPKETQTPMEVERPKWSNAASDGDVVQESLGIWTGMRAIFQEFKKKKDAK